MDPLSVCLGVITLFQETYLLVKYVHKTVSTAKDSDEDREDVAARMRWEILVLESFGRCFTQVNGSLTDDSMLGDVRISAEYNVPKSRADVLRSRSGGCTKYSTYWKS